jgi:hypothetical protein
MVVIDDASSVCPYTQRRKNDRLNVEQWKQIAPYNFFILVYERKETLSFLFISGKRHHFDFE